MVSPSLAIRSLVAVSLMIGFYLLAIAFASGLLLIPYAEWAYGGRIHIKLAIGCIVGAGMIVWAILPRFDSFPAPGPRLTPEAHPDLFTKLRHVAGETGQKMPAEVYLVPDMNAWVANRGGIMGFGSRRVMGLGLPLLQVTSASELEAILAHEFGHYHGGDTRLGPWIYKTRAAIGRTLEAFGEGSWMQLPFSAYGRFFLRITQAISRAQELTADRLAVGVAGARALIDGLKKVHAYSGAFGAYWQQEALPVLNAGFHAPLSDGFARFLKAPRIAQAVDAALAEDLESGKGDLFDSHPPLRERIRAAEAQGDGGRRLPVAERPAIELIGDVRASERALLGFLAVDGDANRFEPIRWDDVAGKVFVPGWRETAARMAPFIQNGNFENATLADLPELLRARGPGLARSVLGRDVEVPAEHLPAVLGGPIGCCITTALLDDGWTPSTDVGEPLVLKRGSAVLEPFAIVAKLYEQPDAGAWWAAFLAEHVIAQLPLAGSAGERTA